MEFREFEDFVGQATAYLVACNEKAQRHFGIGSYPRYEYDLHRGEIWWTEDGVPKVRGKLIVVGTLSTKSDTWLWAWANPYFSDIPLGPIDQVRDFGVTEGIAKLSEEKWAAENVDGWEMTSVSARLLEAQGGYRSPNKLGALFLLFNELAFIAEEDREAYLPLKREEEGGG
ncbi:DUF6882 domain-containing protein [Luteolibacter sp. Populi]|uniref:DUF6882 domain-containing protein n=1 Tax=Luteolibacter sp. Populi TaxID=3230487 RepID=UPI0034677BF7